MKFLTPFLFKCLKLIAEAEVERNTAKNLALFLVLVAACLLLMAYAGRVESGYGKVEVSLGTIETDKGTLTYKLFRPEGATEESPAPGVLLLHGYQNDKDTNAAYALELARRGIVVLSLDEYGHGYTDIPMRERGYVGHKFTVTAGLDSEEDGTFKSVSGALRYKLMMNFSTLSFFNDRYSKDGEGNAVKDSSMGGIDAYKTLSELPFVDSSKLGVSGHSMGTWASWTVSAAYSGTEIMPKATVLQCGELFTEDAYDSESIKFNNVLLLTAKYDEFNYFRDYSKRTVSDEIVNSELRRGFLGSGSSAEWDTTYGDFSDGSARRCELIITNHRLTTHNSHAISVTLDWFAEAFGITLPIPSESLVFMRKEWAGFFALLSAVAAILPLLNMLLRTPFFSSVLTPLPEKPERIKKGWKYWKGAIITMLTAALTYPFMTQLGHGLLPLPENIFRMTIGNGFLSWYLLLILIMLLTTFLSWRKAKKKGAPIDWHDLGFSGKARFDWALCGKGILLGFSLVLCLYLLTALCQALYSLDLRFIWPFFKRFTLPRFGEFLVYIPVFLLFFLLNNSKIMAQSLKPSTYSKGLKSFLSDWYKNALSMAGGIMLIVLVEYIPFFLGIGPGVDLLFSSTFGGPFMSLLIVFLPQVLVFSVLCTYAHRKTGNVYTGATIAAAIACWIVTGGSAFL